MSSLEDIFTLALGVVGISETIDDADAQNHVCNTLRKFWPTARDLTLRSFPWACARRTRALSLLEETSPGWQYAYDYPDNCVLALAVMPEDGLRSRTLWFDCWNNYCNRGPMRYPFERMLRGDEVRQMIVTDLPEAYLIYIARAESVNAFDVGLVMTVSAKLAHLSAATLKVKADMVRLAADTYEIERAKAIADDFNEGYPDVEPDTASLRARE